MPQHGSHTQPATPGPEHSAESNAVNVLFTCVGRRVSLVNSFRAAAGSLGVESSLYGTDITHLSSALQRCDKGILVGRTDDPDYIDQNLEIVRKYHIDLIVPTIDLDLKVLAINRRRFEELGCRVLVSAPDVIDICQDKRKTYRFLTENNFDTPLTMTAAEALENKDLPWPRFLKPWDGHAAKGNVIVADRDELRFHAKRIKNAIVQELIAGDELTCDAWVDFDMKVRCVVPRKRIEVRSGEVSKATIVKNLRVMKAVSQLVETLGAGPGLITVQLFFTPDNRIRFMEINPRFGGGAPLSIRAGADFPKWAIQETLGTEPRIDFDGYQDALTMLRYDAEVWLDSPDNLGTAR